MSFAGKQNLKALIDKNKLSEQSIQYVFHKLVHAVKYLHEEYITHRDLKLENMVLN